MGKKKEIALRNGVINQNEVNNDDAKKVVSRLNKLNLELKDGKMVKRSAEKENTSDGQTPADEEAIPAFSPESAVEPDDKAVPFESELDAEPASSSESTDAMMPESDPELDPTDALELEPTDDAEEAEVESSDAENRVAIVAPRALDTNRQDGPGKAYKYWDYENRLWVMTQNFWVARQASDLWDVVWVWLKDGQIHHIMSKREMQRYLP